VVFASGKNRTNVATRLHTDFELDARGGYLVLVQPDGNDRGERFQLRAPAAQYQLWVGGSMATTPLLSVGAPARVLIPVAPPAAGWTGGSEPFDDSAWLTGATGVGFDVSTNDSAG